MQHERGCRVPERVMAGTFTSFMLLSLRSNTSLYVVLWSLILADCTDTAFPFHFIYHSFTLEPHSPHRAVTLSTALLHVPAFSRTARFRVTHILLVTMWIWSLKAAIWGLMVDLIDTCSKNCESPVCRDGVRRVSDGPPGLSLVSSLPVSDGNWLIMGSYKETSDKYDETQTTQK